MAYGKRYRKSYKKKNYKSSWYNRKYSALDLAKKALTATQYIKGMINCEKKYHLAYTNIAPNTGGSLACLSQIAQGDTASTRDGNSILARSILLNIDVAKNTNATDTKCRIILFQDVGYSVDAATLQGSDILDSSLMGTSYAPMAPVAQKTNGRFKVLRNWSFTLNSTLLNKRIHEYVKIYTHIKYDGTDATTTSMNKNQFYLLFVSDQDTYMPGVELVTKLGFYDN